MAIVPINERKEIPMKMTFRWYGLNDCISLQTIKQIPGMTGLMGLLDNKLTVLGSDVKQVALDMTKTMVNEETALITVYYGSDVTEEDAQALVDEITALYSDYDVGLQYGGQPLYYFLIAVE